MPDRTAGHFRYRYVVSVDIGGTGKDSDYSSIKVADRLPMLEGGIPEIVAEWHGHIEHDLLIWKAAQIAYAYCEALLVVESNTLETEETEGDNFEYVIDEIVDFYPHLYSRTSAEQIKQGAPVKYGFHTNPSTKPMILNFLKAAMRDSLYIERSLETTFECDQFEIKEGGKKTGAQAVAAVCTVNDDHRDIADCFSGIERHSSQWDPLIRQKIYRACMTIEQEYNRRLPGWQQQIVGQLMLMASDVIREVPKAALSATVQRDDSLRRVLGYLSEHFLEPVTLRDCAAALGFNPSYLSGMFALRTGAPFHRYLLNLRLKKAEWLLASGELPVSEVALESGFSSDKTFYRVFREQYGLSPGDYRKKLRDKIKNGAMDEKPPYL